MAKIEWNYPSVDCNMANGTFTDRLESAAVWLCEWDGLDWSRLPEHGARSMKDRSTYREAVNNIHKLLGGYGVPPAPPMPPPPDTDTGQ